MSLFPDTDYAHCPHCGTSEGMGLSCANGKWFVLCICGAQGPGVLRSEFLTGVSLDVKKMDNAARKVWNSRAGSDGIPELQIALNDAVGRMLAYKNPEILIEVEQWAALMTATPSN